MSSTRYPYTYAADYVRGLAGYNESGTKLSRSDASTMISAIAQALGLEKESLCKRLADAELAKSDEDHEKQAEEFLRIQKERQL